MIKENLIQVMDTEMKAIASMIQGTNEQYNAVVRVLSQCRGKIVFMGIGKSGHIGEKLAATFSSTGTPSFFVHAAEAVHGDLGMIEKHDVVILISNSGNTMEVTRDIPFLKKIGCTTIAMTSNPDSQLAGACDYLLLYPDLPEADHLDLAPTVSSTLTLVLGDALACTLSKMRGFTRNDFYRYHPGGALGASLAGAEDAPEETVAQPAVTVVGSFVVDMVVNVERFPAEGETLLGSSLDVHLGGKGINQCVALQRLGVQTEMIGMLGEDANADAFRQLMREEGIVSERVFRTQKVPTAVAQVQIDQTVQNKIIVCPSSNYQFGLEHLEQAKDALLRSKLVVTQLELRIEVVSELIRFCSANGIPVLLNPAPAAALPEDVLSKVDYLTPNEVELSILTGMPTGTDEQVKAAAGRLLEQGVKNVIATLGEKGALVANADTMEIIPGFQVERAVDTVAAGDSFNGALAKCIVEGKPLTEAARFANAMGALTVTKQGAIPSLHRLNEVEEFLRRQGAN